MDKEQAVLFCVHGAGYSALSFALLTRYMPGIAIISVDLRGHGIACSYSLELFGLITGRVFRIITRWHGRRVDD